MFTIKNVEYKSNERLKYDCLKRLKFSNDYYFNA